MNALDEDALARFRGRNVGIVFQSFHLIPTMTALENVAVPLELAGIADAQARARDELAAVGLGERLHHYPAELSGGEQQRVAVARALAPNPAILVADEPTGNLDEDTGKQIIDLLFAGHVKRGTTLVLVTHDAALAARCGRIVRLRSGRIDGVSTPVSDRRVADVHARDATRHSGCRCVSRCANCAAACAASTSSSPASRSACMAIAGVGSLAASLADGLGARGPGHPRRRSGVHADPARGLHRTSARSCKSHGKVSSAATMRAMARDRRRQSHAGRNESGRRRLSAVTARPCSIRPAA